MLFPKRIILSILAALSFNTYSQNITVEQIEFGGRSEGVGLSCFGLYNNNGDLDELGPYSKIVTTVRTVRKTLNNTEKKLWVEFKNQSFDEFKALGLVKKIKFCDELKQMFPSTAET